MKKIFLAGLMAGLICILPSCAKKCPTASYNPSAENQIKKYFFKAGSYWVYQDSASGTIDSQSVYNYSPSLDVVVGNYSAGNGLVCNSYGDIYGMGIARFWNGLLHDSIGFGNDLNVTDVQIAYSDYNSQYDIYDYPITNSSQTLINFNVSGHTFPTVYSSISNFNSLMYHVDSVGVVKWVFNDTINGQHTWNLLRYHVINP